MNCEEECNDCGNDRGLDIENKETDIKIKNRNDKFIFSIHPDRNNIIQKDEITDLIILLNTTMCIQDFLSQI